MKTRKGFIALDQYFEEYLLTKCPKYPNRFIGSCHDCKEYILEKQVLDTVIVTCKK